MKRRDFLAAGGGSAAALGLGLPVLAAQPATPASGGPTLERRLVDYALGVRYENLPIDIVDSIKRLLLDTLGCAFGAVGAAPAKIAEATFRKAYGSRGTASICGGRQGIGTEGAALVNGVLTRYLDFNDIYVGSEPLHPSEIIPAAIACCEEAGRSGRELIETLVVGYEGETRINDALTYLDRGMHPLSVAGLVAPLVAGKAWRMPSDKIEHAIGISGTREFTMFVVNSGEISMMKALGHAYICMDAIFSTRMAAAGFTGPQNVIQWIATKVGPPKAKVEIDFSQENFRLPKVGLKRFPLQFEMQSAVEAGVDLHRELAGKAGSIREVVIETYPKIRERTAGPVMYKPGTRETADHSLPVCTAMALLDGDVTGEQFRRERWRGADVLALAGKVTVRNSEILMAKFPKGRGSVLEVHLEDGRVLRREVEIPEGDAERPMSRPSLEHKFRQLAEPVLGRAGATRVIGMVDRLEEVKDVRSFASALRGRA